MFDEPETHHNLNIKDMFCYCNEILTEMKHLETDDKNGETWTCSICKRVIHIVADKIEVK